MSIEISIELGGGKWNKGQRDHIIPIVYDAAELAVIGVEEFNLSSSSPLKTAKVFMAVNRFENAGACNNATDFELYFPYRSIKHRKAELIADQLPGTVMHELTHCLRFERYPVVTLTEAIATEGIAYVLEHEFNQITLGEHNFNLFDFLPEISPRSMKKLLEELGNADFQHAEIDELAVEDFQLWDSPYTDYSFASRVDIIGISTVSALRSMGMPFAEIIELPADLIIDEGTQIAA